MDMGKIKLPTSEITSARLVGNLIMSKHYVDSFFKQVTHLGIWGSILSWIIFLGGYSYVWHIVDLAPEMFGMVGNFWVTPLLVMQPVS